MVDFRPLLFINALALMLLVTAGFASIQDDGGPLLSARALIEKAPKSPDKAPKPLDKAPDTPQPDNKASPSVQSPAPGADNAAVFADVGTAHNISEAAIPDAGDAVPISANELSAAQGSMEGANTDLPSEGSNAPKTADSSPAQLALISPQVSVESTDATVSQPEPPVPPSTAQLTLRSNVLGDSVRINGKSYGSTRLDIELNPGDYDVVISKKGYKNWSQTLRLDAGDDLTLRGQLEEYTRVNYQDGIWVGGVRTGDGTYTGEEGSGEGGLEYTGHFVDGQFHGKGTALYPDGSRYRGDWSAGKRSGEGTFRAADGSSYTGQFDNDEFNGQGTLTRANGDVLTGQWSGGRLEGHGSLTTANGMFYVGGFKAGKFHGEGTLTYPDGRHYQGGFSNGEYHGEGSEILSDGKKYVGQYIEGDFHGQGTLMNPNGSSIEATFRYGEPYGQAKLVTPEGEIFNARTSEPGVCYREKSYRATQCPPLEGW
ncbi:MORN repeat-containing protein [Marinobacter fonticola]|uniref:MORN repeat-containing protein n=1 Tax=Marinobacter fonticola TaxID=2603215 RepID=UPI0011E82AFC|nr:PEGA domain-containing protein [Marinobacter fonticola]